ncbi:hypothetical protein [Seleniivibrio woodruffii]|uniref:hypothetical protein n=1 Tax=Seleniivibrio woodruffii TaxID=1078050 RepID=UPI0026EF5FD0|nr:hypothetical protein [Seleniivibrio woodruffii]
MSVSQNLISPIYNANASVSSEKEHCDLDKGEKKPDYFAAPVKTKKEKAISAIALARNNLIRF